MIFVVSHHTVRYGMVSLDEVVSLAHAKGVPVIVDAASEYDLRGFLARGADRVVYSGHKSLGGPISGIVAGKAELIEACRLQNLGIGRCMKVGKENIAGVIGALEAWEARDHQGVREAERRRLDHVRAGLADLQGIAVETVPGPTDNPIDRLRVQVDPMRAGTTAAELARALSQQQIVVRGHEVELGRFYVDVCNMRDGEDQVLVAKMRELLA